MPEDCKQLAALHSLIQRRSDGCVVGGCTTQFCRQNGRGWGVVNDVISLNFQCTHTTLNTLLVTLILNTTQF